MAEEGQETAVGELVRAELARHDWAELDCGCGESAEHLPLLFEAILEARTARDMIGYTLDGHAEWNGDIFACTPPAVAVIMAALAGELSVLARDELLDTLWRVSAGEFFRDHGLVDRSRSAALEGFWPLVRIGLTGNAELAAQVAGIIEMLELGGERGEHYRGLLCERAAAKTKRRRPRL
ncbi:hypothetical protein ACFYU9_01050 [Streptomyces sp. NPDC004327]|uniref:hypothetical protein n=1 Tax=unclassified Streptomyces TaxID=2593676 RepID=UPI0036766873